MKENTLFSSVELELDSEKKLIVYKMQLWSEMKMKMA
jgi:hypothetical protein